VRQVVEEILNGNFNFDKGSLDFSCPRIDLSLLKDTVEEGTFSIYGPEGCVTEGYIVSTDLRMECMTKHFSGSQDEVLYRFDARGMEAGDEVKGAFYVISNQGEYYLPFCVTIVQKSITSSLGTIKNLFHFTNLAKSNWEEAVKLFYSEEFEEVFKGSSRQYYAAYKGLSANPGNEHNMEEFLLEINKKKPVEYLPEETQISLEDPDGTTRYALVINKNGWGYTHLAIRTEGDFLKTEDDTVTESAFLGNIYRLYYYIEQERLHAGSNFGAIVLEHASGTIRIPVTVTQHTGNKKHMELHREKKQLNVSLMEYYQAYRLKKISTRTWLSETHTLLNRMMEIDDRDVTLKLFQAQLLLTEERNNEAKWLIEKQEAQVIALRGERPEVWCYYLYLTTLYSKDEQYVDDVTALVEETYQENRGNWRIAWLMMYLSDRYVKSASRKWELLEELFRYRCNSPVIYIEAWHILCMNPAMLLRLGSFELQILLYAVRNDLMRDDILLQVVYLAGQQKTYSEHLFQILKGCYEARPQSDILHAICSLLIKGNCQGEKYFAWYSAGVEQNLRITRLYEYYMMSISLSYEGPLPKMILMYFAYQSDLRYEITAYLYAYVYKHREEIPDIYINYSAAMERFVVEQIHRGRINKDLAYLYRHLISLPMIDEKSAGQLASLLFMQEIRVEDERITEVHLVYPYGAGETSYPVTGGRAMVPVYDSDCKILLGDGTGNRYTASVEFQAEAMLNPVKLALLISPFVREHLGYAVYICYEYQNTRTVQDNNVDLFVRLAASDRIEETTRREIRMMLVEFYYEKDRMRELDEYLVSLHPEDVAEFDRGKVIRYLSARGMYEEAYEWVKSCGPYKVDTKVLLKLCSRFLSTGEQENEEDPVMTSVLCYILQKGKYDDRILTYLVNYYTGGIKQMRDVWRAAEDFGVDTYAICERMLIQMLYTGAHVGEKSDILRSYSRRGGKEELIAAFLSQCCYDYAVNEQITEDYIFESVAELCRKKVPLHLVCKIAFLQHYAENRKERTEPVMQVCCRFLEELLEERIVLPVYKQYIGYLPQLDQYLDKTIIEYRAKPGTRALIHYVIQSEGSADNEYWKEEMKDVFAGICVKEFVLFFGERLQYYITEQTAGGEQLTKSGTVSRSDTEQGKEGRFDLLNDIMIGENLQDYETVNHLLLEYYRQDYMVDQIFKIRK
jgi:hypothetical protein